MTQSIAQKHLEVFLDAKLDLQEHLKCILSTVNKWFITEAAPHITEIGAIKRTSKEKLYNEQGLEALENRRSYRKLLLFKDFQIKMSKIPIQYYYHFCDYMQHQKYS